MVAWIWPTVKRLGGREREVSHRCCTVGSWGVAPQLAHLGLGEIIGIDADHAAKTNRDRLTGMTRLDLWLRRKQTTITRRVVKTVGLSTWCRTDRPKTGSSRREPSLAQAARPGAQTRSRSRS